MYTFLARSNSWTTRWTHSFGDNALVVEMLADALHELHLLFWGQPIDRAFNNAPERHFVDGDEAVIVHVCEKSHDELAVHAVGDSTVTRNRVTKVLDLKGALEAGGKETPERGNEGSEGSEDQDVNLHRGHVERLEVGEPDWEVVQARKKNRVGCALEAGPDVCSEILARFFSRALGRSLSETHIHRANEVLVSHQNIGHAHSKDDCENPSPDKPFYGLFWRQLDELCPAKRDSTDIGKDIVANNQRDGQEEPDHSLEDIVHNEVRLHYNQV